MKDGTGTKLAVETGGGKRVPSKRYAKPAIAVVKMDDVPQPPPRNGDIAAELYEQIGRLKMGTALCASFENEAHAEYVKGKLRNKARDDRQVLGASRSADGKSRYFWLEKL